MLRVLKYAISFGVLAGLGILLGCYIHGIRTNQSTLMSGVAFVRELPQGERIVGYIETTVFSYQEKRSLEDYQEKHKGKIKIDPEVLKKHKELYKEGSGSGQQN
ncbi:MAG TPA: hypothetical protein VK463_01110 [Desulfomonilaceae bacterium]|nr:hypothetical protein [Desulfomonilaceae bacterium]